jgi:hypothetical protein
MPNGIYESVGVPVTPSSLYLAQLKQRLGIPALNAIGYADVGGSPFTGTVVPVFSPAPGTFNNAVVVKISSPIPGVSIYYTTDGSVPTAANGTLYTGPVTITLNTTFTAYAIMSGMTGSGFAKGAYTVLRGG